MAYVKSGKDIKNMQDVQNLIIGIINRQTKEFKQTDIMNMVLYHLKGTKLKLKKEKIEDIIIDNLSFLYLKGIIDCRCGIYTPKMKI